AAAQLGGAAVILYNQQDAGGERYDLHTELVSYREQQQATFVHIPLMLSYQSRHRHPLYAQAGVKLSIPLGARYEIRDAVIRSESYYPALDNTVQGPPYMGFGTFSDRSAEGTLDMKLVYTAAAEAGVKWRLARALSLYAGLFVDYGLTEALRSPRTESLMQPNAAAPESFTMGSVLASRYAPDNRAIDKVSLMAAGLKLRLAFGFTPFDAPQLSAKPIPQEDALCLVQARKEAALAQRLKAADEAKQQRDVDEAQRQKFEAELRRTVADIRLRQQQHLLPLQEEEELAYVEVKKAIEQPVAGYTVNQTALTPNQKSDLNRKAALLKQNPSLNVICVGHTCDIGSDKVNYRISRSRAETVSSYLVQQGVDGSRISLLGEGSLHPLIPNANEKNRRVNRRVAILILADSPPLQE
ncbi:MAG: OmpA family protein, partial [Prevotellaceae bacterium]|nr:OmpA family protein [Prevotellaceae bacterium]